MKESLVPGYVTEIETVKKEEVQPYEKDHSYSSSSRNTGSDERSRDGGRYCQPACHNQVNQVAKLKASDTTVTITVGAPTNGGDDPAVTITNNTNTCGYTSVVATGNTRKLTGATDSDLSAKGMALTLLPAGVPSGCGTAAASAVTLTTAGAELITGIGSCKTGNNNVTLTYGLTISDVTKLTSGSTSVVVTLTLTD